MEPQSSERIASGKSLKWLYWVAAAAMTIATVMGAMERAHWMTLAGRTSLIAALVLLATAKPVETRAKKVLLIVRIVQR